MEMAPVVLEECDADEGGSGPWAEGGRLELKRVTAEVGGTGWNEEEERVLVGCWEEEEEKEEEETDVAEVVDRLDEKVEADAVEDVEVGVLEEKEEEEEEEDAVGVEDE